MQFGQKVFSGPMPLAITVSHITVNLHNRLAAARAIYKLQSRLIRRTRSSSCSRRAGADFILNLAVATGARLPLPPPLSPFPAQLQLVANAQSFGGKMQPSQSANRSSKFAGQAALPDLPARSMAMHRQSRLRLSVCVCVCVCAI